VNWMPGDFLDSNILVYAFTADPRAVTARTLLERDAVISVQGLNEFANVARCKLGRTWAEVREALDAIRAVCGTIVPVDIDTHSDALRIAERYGYAIFDALMIAAAVRADCKVLWSEDMHDGQVIDKRLRIANPFSQDEPVTG
jgi:predicted nucleic acid-binding protein